ncbi:MAG: M23 family metallopeptidase [Thermoanaerobaculia bacterium]|nr:M23 family metallopeptidase [Thermoanaerobaculia bacterium]
MNRNFANRTNAPFPSTPSQEPSSCEGPGRPRWSFAAIIAVVFASLAVSLAAPSCSQLLTPAPIELRVLTAPTALPAIGRQHLVYEVVLTNFGPEPRVLQSLAVLDGRSDRVLTEWSGDELPQRLSRIGSGGPTAEAPWTLGPGESALAFLWITLSAADVPDSLRHRLTTTDLTGMQGDSFSTETLALQRAQPITVEPPVPAGRWVALRGPSNTSGHRRSVVTLDGAAHNAQRYAIDWARLGEDGQLFRARGQSNEDWYGYGQSVTAVQGGTVARVIDGIPDHAPLSPEAARFANRAQATGNTVIVDQGSGRFAVYAHLRPGTLAVQEGDRVETGEVLGEIGNSGHSLAPHLHFHIADRVDPLASDGIPYVVSRFVLEGRLESLRAAVSGTPWHPETSRPAREVVEELPLENMVLSFDGGARSESGESRR